MVFCTMNQFVNIALLFKAACSDGFNCISVFIDNTNQKGKCLAIDAYRIIEIHTTVDDSYFIARCDGQGAHLLYSLTII